MLQIFPALDRGIKTNHPRTDLPQQVQDLALKQIFPDDIDIRNIGTNDAADMATHFFRGKIHPDQRQRVAAGLKMIAKQPDRETEVHQIRIHETEHQTDLESLRMQVVLLTGREIPVFLA